MPGALLPVSSFSHPYSAGPKYPPTLARLFHSASPPACASAGRHRRTDAVTGPVALQQDSAAQSAMNAGKAAAGPCTAHALIYACIHAYNPPTPSAIAAAHHTHTSEQAPLPRRPRLTPSRESARTSTPVPAASAGSSALAQWYADLGGGRRPPQQRYTHASPAAQVSPVRGHLACRPRRTCSSGAHSRIPAPMVNGAAVCRRRSFRACDDHPTATAVTAAKVYGTAVSSTAAVGPPPAAAWPPRRSEIARGVQKISA